MNFRWTKSPDFVALDAFGEMSPALTKALAEAGFLALDLGRFEWADEVFTLLLKQDSSREAGYFGLILSALVRGQRLRATKLLAKASKEIPASSALDRLSSIAIEQRIS